MEHKFEDADVDVDGIVEIWCSCGSGFIPEAFRMHMKETAPPKPFMSLTHELHIAELLQSLEWAGHTAEPLRWDQSKTGLRCCPDCGSVKPTVGNKNHTRECRLGSALDYFDEMVDKGVFPRV